MQTRLTSLSCLSWTSQPRFGFTWARLIGVKGPGLEPEVVKVVVGGRWCCLAGPELDRSGKGDWRGFGGLVKGVRVRTPSRKASSLDERLENWSN